MAVKLRCCSTKTVSGTRQLPAFCIAAPKNEKPGTGPGLSKQRKQNCAIAIRQVPTPASSSTASDSFLTIGATTTIVGNATEKATLQALSQIEIRLSTNPTFRVLTTNDIKQDINSAIKNAKTIGWYFLGINLGLLLN
jgi:hypothetical protein